MTDLLNQILGFEKVLRSELELSPHEISLYLALVLEWNSKYRPNRFFEIRQEHIVRLGRIGNTKTYYKYLKSLANKQLIAYKPGWRNKMAQIFIIPLVGKKRLNQENITFAISPITKLHLANSQLATDVAANSPVYLKEKDIKKYESISKGVNKINEIQKKPFAVGATNLTNPTEIEVIAEFHRRGYEMDEALRFYRHYSGTGWKTQKGEPIIWQNQIHFWNENSYNKVSPTANINIEEIVSALCYQLMKGQDIWNNIRPEYSEILKLKITNGYIESARNRRILALETSSEKSDSDLLMAYRSGEPGHPLVQKDFNVIAKIAKIIAVHKYLAIRISQENKNI